MTTLYGAYALHSRAGSPQVSTDVW